MAVYSLGNPIDLPVRVTIDPLPGPFALTAPRFANGLCTEDDPANHCTLPPGKGMAVSNASTASGCFPVCPEPVPSKKGLGPQPQKPAPTARWSARISPAPQGQPQPGDSLHLRLTLQFQGEQGIMSVYRELESAPLEQCAVSH